MNGKWNADDIATIRNRGRGGPVATGGKHAMEEEASVAPNSSRTDLDSIAQRVDQAIADVQKLEGEARAKAMALKSAIEAFHKVGFTEIVKKLKADPRGKELLLELAQVPA
ncbi:MAG TPA: hypothetical protein ENJ16_02080, partial [Planctomycetaceae bacterium]|nr:hypothetical protein [Planctomycetaceae bacterium]